VTLNSAQIVRATQSAMGSRPAKTLRNKNLIVVFTDIACRMSLRECDVNNLKQCVSPSPCG
jgi:hypothetical protein